MVNLAPAAASKRKVVAMPPSATAAAAKRLKKNPVVVVVVTQAAPDHYEEIIARRYRNRWAAPAGPVDNRSARARVSPRSWGWDARSSEGSRLLPPRPRLRGTLTGAREQPPRSEETNEEASSR